MVMKSQNVEFYKDFKIINSVYENTYKLKIHYLFTLFKYKESVYFLNKSPVLKNCIATFEIKPFVNNESVYLVFIKNVILPVFERVLTMQTTTR